MISFLLQVAFCAVFFTGAVALPQVNSVVMNPSSHSTDEMGLSFLDVEAYYDTGAASMIFSFPAGASFGGNANFAVTTASLTSGRMDIPLTTSYKASPICHLNFQNYDGQVRLQTTKDDVSISLRNSDGSSKSWTLITTSNRVAFFLTCHGVVAP